MSGVANKLEVTNHSRDSAGLTYVYPVLSRRAGGVSIGINLNPNNACNWRCIYCQVPGLRRGAAPPIDLTMLERELRGFIDSVLHGDFMHAHLAEATGTSSMSPFPAMASPPPRPNFLRQSSLWAGSCGKPGWIER